MAAAVVKAMEGRAGALIANHGAITAGRTLKEAFVATNVLEKTAMIYIMCQSIGGPTIIPQKDIDFFHDFLMNKYGRGK